MEPLHEHNQRTYENICRMYNEGIQRIAVVQPTGSGKSLLMAKLIEDNPNSRFFVLSTSHKINEQFKEKLDEKTLERIECNIYCNMPNMKQEIMESLQPDYVFLDEMHRALAKEWSKGIMCLLEMYPNVKVLGLSATPIRYLDRCRNVAEELFGGNLACDMSLSQAILDGILPMARYVCGIYSYEKDAESLNKKILHSCNSEEEKKELLKELKNLKENLDKGHGVSDIFRKYIVNGSEKFVVFLKDTTHLSVMKPVIEKWFTDAGFTVRMYEVHCKNADKDKEFQAFKEDKEDGIIKLCLSVNMISEGIHGDIDGVIMLRETISPNMYFQMIGRVFSCGKKTIPLIFDLVANSQFISDAADNFSNEIKREIQKRKEECEKEGKEYDPGFDVDEFIVMDEFMDVVSGFRAIEGRLGGREWTEEENDVLREYYPIEGSRVVDRLEGRTKAATMEQARRLGIKRTFVWSEKEIEILKNYYPMERMKVKERLDGRTKKAIRKMVLILGLDNVQNAPNDDFNNSDRKWTSDELGILKKYYPIEGIKVIGKLKDRTKPAIVAKAGMLGLKVLNDNFWTNEEERILEKYYPVEGMRVIKRLGGRTKAAIQSRVLQLNLKAPCRWTEEENEILKRYYPQYGTDIKEFLPNRSARSIRCQARRLNISSCKQRGYRSIFTYEEDKIIREYYPIEGNEVYKRLENKSKIQCKNRAMTMGVHKIKI